MSQRQPSGKQANLLINSLFHPIWSRRLTVIRLAPRMAFAWPFAVAGRPVGVMRRSRRMDISLLDNDPRIWGIVFIPLQKKRRKALFRLAKGLSRRDCYGVVQFTNIHGGKRKRRCYRLSVKCPECWRRSGSPRLNVISSETNDTISLPFVTLSGNTSIWHIGTYAFIYFVYIHLPAAVLIPWHLIDVYPCLFIYPTYYLWGSIQVGDKTSPFLPENTKKGRLYRGTAPAGYARPCESSAGSVMPAADLEISI